MESKGLIPPSPLKLTGNLLENWSDFKEEFKIYLTAGELYGPIPEKVKVANFLNLMGKEAFQLHRLIKYPECGPGKGLNLKILMGGFEDYFTNCHNSEIYNSFQFNDRKQLEGETFDDFIVAISKMAFECNFHDDLERRIRDKIVSGINDPNLRIKLMMMEDHTLDGIIDYCREVEKQKNDEALSTVNMTEENEFFMRKFLKTPFQRNTADISRSMNSPRQPTIIRQNKTVSPSKAPKKTSDKETDEILKENLLKNVEGANKPSTSRQEDPGNSDGAGEGSVRNKGHFQKNWNSGNQAQSKVKYACSQCPNTYERLLNLKNHEKIHTQQGLQCEFCKKTYIRRACFATHEAKCRINKKTIKPLSCTYCGKMFSKKNDLHMHLNSHSDEK